MGAHIVDNYQGELKVMLYPSDNQIDSASINAQMAETGCVRLATGRKAGKIPDDLYHLRRWPRRNVEHCGSLGIPGRMILMRSADLADGTRQLDKSKHFAKLVTLDVINE